MFYVNLLTSNSRYSCRSLCSSSSRPLTFRSGVAAVRSASSEETALNRFSWDLNCSSCRERFRFLIISNQRSAADTSGRRARTWDSLVLDPGSRGRLNLFWEPMAAGNGGAENMAATTLMRVIHDCICSAFLQNKRLALTDEREKVKQASSVKRHGSYGAWNKKTLQSAVLR